ncbi:MAG TPA: carboxypeptidase-like regulatory domain-containing protein, partial [Terriglobales bacterium]|nr:carboxypeptidase-like regulatory domain-containing protein [Terriglobales bacterium]
MRRFSLAVRVVLLVVSILALTALTQAQYRTSIQGVVTDSTGAVIPGATLTLTNPATNEKQVRTSDANGVFNFNALPASVVFRLEVSMKGFQNKRIDDLQLIPEQPNAVNITLDIGSASQTVNVNGDAIAALDTETASVNGVVT